MAQRKTRFRKTSPREVDVIVFRQRRSRLRSRVKSLARSGGADGSRRAPQDRWCIGSIPVGASAVGVAGAGAVPDTCLTSDGLEAANDLILRPSSFITGAPCWPRLPQANVRGSCQTSCRSGSRISYGGDAPQGSPKQRSACLASLLSFSDNAHTGDESRTQRSALSYGGISSAFAAQRK